MTSDHNPTPEQDAIRAIHATRDAVMSTDQFATNVAKASVSTFFSWRTTEPLTLPSGQTVEVRTLSPNLLAFGKTNVIKQSTVDALLGGEAVSASDMGEVVEVICRSQITSPQILPSGSEPRQPTEADPSYAIPFDWLSTDDAMHVFQHTMGVTVQEEQAKAESFPTEQ